MVSAAPADLAAAAVEGRAVVSAAAMVAAAKEAEDAVQAAVAVGRTKSHTVL